MRLIKTTLYIVQYEDLMEGWQEATLTDSIHPWNKLNQIKNAKKYAKEHPQIFVRVLKQTNEEIKVWRCK